jgi:hypothetical protein
MDDLVLPEQEQNLQSNVLNQNKEAVTELQASQADTSNVGGNRAQSDQFIGIPKPDDKN